MEFKQKIQKLEGQELINLKAELELQLKEIELEIIDRVRFQKWK